MHTAARCIASNAHKSISSQHKDLLPHDGLRALSSFMSSLFVAFVSESCPPLWMEGRAPGPHSALCCLSGCFLILLALKKMNGFFLYLHKHKHTNVSFCCKDSQSHSLFSGHTLYFIFIFFFINNLLLLTQRRKKLNYWFRCFGRHHIEFCSFRRRVVVFKNSVLCVKYCNEPLSVIKMIRANSKRWVSNEVSHQLHRKESELDVMESFFMWCTNLFLTLKSLKNQTAAHV